MLVDSRVKCNRYGNHGAPRTYKFQFFPHLCQVTVE
jgi:hypothetical protein